MTFLLNLRCKFVTLKIWLGQPEILFKITPFNWSLWGNSCVELFSKVSERVPSRTFYSPSRILWFCNCRNESKINHIWRSMQFFKITTDFLQIWAETLYVTSSKLHIQPKNSSIHMYCEHQYSYCIRESNYICVSATYYIFACNSASSSSSTKKSPKNLLDSLQLKKKIKYFGINNKNNSAKSWRVCFRMS